MDRQEIVFVYICKKREEDDDDEQIAKGYTFERLKVFLFDSFLL